jgi:uncharacterized protein YdhG (YjbR/CyaY superfamily)
MCAEDTNQKKLTEKPTPKNWKIRQKVRLICEKLRKKINFAVYFSTQVKHKATPPTAKMY